MTKIIKVDSCENGPKIRYEDLNALKPFITCWIIAKEILDKTKIPNWCPFVNVMGIDYNKIAEIIKKNKDKITVGGVTIEISNVNLIADLANYFDNDPNFDRKKFMDMIM